MQPPQGHPSAQHRAPATPRHHLRTPRRAYWHRRRRAAILIVLMILCIPMAAAGWYVNNITTAITDVQNRSVVDLPTRNTGDDSTAGAGTPSVTSESRPGGPSSFEVARDILSAGTGGPSTSPQKVWPDSHYLNILVLGVDTRDDGGDQNADTIIIARLDLREKTMRSVSIPRDLLVEIPGVGSGKINGAYNAGVTERPNDRVAGVVKMRDTIEHNFGVEIDDYVLIDFEGFEQVIDSVGGIQIDVPEEIVDDAYPTEDYGVRTLVIKAGPQHMDGDTALAYARTRHADSDDERRDRQALVIQALFQKGKSLGTITKIADIIQAAGGAAQTSFHWDEQIALAAIALDMDQGDIDMLNLQQPLVEPGTTADGAWVYLGDADEIAAFIESSLSGDTP